jgi:hypothetical protein
MKSQFSFIDKEIVIALLQTALIGLLLVGLGAGAAMLARWTYCLVVPLCPTLH